MGYSVWKSKSLVKSIGWAHMQSVQLTLTAPLKSNNGVKSCSELRVEHSATTTQHLASLFNLPKLYYLGGSSHRAALSCYGFKSLLLAMCRIPFTVWHHLLRLFDLSVEHATLSCNEV